MKLKVVIRLKVSTTSMKQLVGIFSGCRTESLDNINKESSGNFHQQVSINKICEWAINSKVNREQFSNTAKATVSCFSTSLANGHSQYFFNGKSMLIASKGQMDPFTTWHMMDLSSDI